MRAEVILLYCQSCPHLAPQSRWLYFTKNSRYAHKRNIVGGISVKWPLSWAPYAGRWWERNR